MNRPNGVSAAGLLWLLISLCVGTAGCGGLGSRSAAPVNSAFEMNGELHRLSEYRGANVMLVLIRTSEVVSQIYMMRLSEVYATIAIRCRVVVLTLEPDEARFVDLYREDAKLPFPLGVTDSSVREGLSALGRIPGVPVTYLIDQKGMIVQQVAGVIEPSDIIELVERFFER